jgi:Fe2+ transport system protein FeoA
MKTLCELNRNDNAVIKEVTNPLVYDSLCSHGFTVGSLIKIISKLPFKGAITCEINNSRFALRACDAANVVVFD